MSYMAWNDKFDDVGRTKNSSKRGLFLMLGMTILIIKEGFSFDEKLLIASIKSAYYVNFRDTPKPKEN